MPMPQASNPRLMFCEMLIPVPNTAGSSVRMISNMNRVIG
jgi:hypothetical protein